MWRAGFDECHGSDICDSDNWPHHYNEHYTWANVQVDAEKSRVFRSIEIAVTMLCLLGNMVLIDKKHTAALSISWKVLCWLQVVTLGGEIPLTFVPQSSYIVAAQALRTTGNDVSGLPSPVCTLAPCPPLPNPFSRYSFTRWRRKTSFAATTWWR